jgi:hypothetical protein
MIPGTHGSPDPSRLPNARNPPGVPRTKGDLEPAGFTGSEGGSDGGEAEGNLGGVGSRPQ